MAIAEKTTVTPAELKRMMDAGEEFTLLDVRNDDEFARWRIKGDTIPLSFTFLTSLPLKTLKGFCLKWSSKFQRNGLSSLSALRATHRSGLPVSFCARKAIGLSTWKVV